ncbi:hypothetical protein ALMP_68670 [Streptomyces sp. A012304]|nr:hypothetical protein ALMP_68670 [Streptomyces sp. A012304]
MERELLRSGSRTTVWTAGLGMAVGPLSVEVVTGLGEYPPGRADERLTGLGAAPFEAVPGRG